MGGRVPPGIKLVRYVLGRAGREHQYIKTYQLTVLVLTFIAYACYHASRKPPSIVKSVLDPEPPVSVSSSPPWPVGEVFVRRCNGSEEGDGVLKRKLKKGWAPFDGPYGTAKLGEIDLAFLAFYAIGMYIAGRLGDVFDLRVFLSVGMITSGGFVGLFGMGYFWNVHRFSYYLIAQMLAGLFQSTGWPSVVAVVGNWFGERKRGLIMGVWSAHTSVGNICGSLLAASVLQYGWGWSFALPAAVIIGGGILVYLFLVAYPEDIGFTKPKRKQECVNKDEEIGNLNGVEGGNLGGRVDVGKKEGGRKGSAVEFKEACLIPGVIPFALCLFFSKLVAYTFLYWLPFYLSQTEIGGEYMSVKSAGNLSTLFDVGGIVGGILAGYISDQLNARALTASVFMYLAIPAMYFYNRYGRISQFTNILLMMIAGLFVNGPYALITTAVSADLGTHSSLKGDSRALATVTSIIDGTGSIGAALGPLLTGFISLKGWELVFIMLMIGAFVAGIMLISLVRIEVLQLVSRWKEPSPSSCNPINGDSYSEPLLPQNTS